MAPHVFRFGPNFRFNTKISTKKIQCILASRIDDWNVRFCAPSYNKSTVCVHVRINVSIVLWSCDDCNVCMLCY